MPPKIDVGKIPIRGKKKTRSGGLRGTIGSRLGAEVNKGAQRQGSSFSRGGGGVGQGTPAIGQPNIKIDLEGWNPYEAAKQPSGSPVQDRAPYSPMVQETLADVGAQPQFQAAPPPQPGAPPPPVAVPTELPAAPVAQPPVQPAPQPAPQPRVAAPVTNINRTAPQNQRETAPAMTAPVKSPMMESGPAVDNPWFQGQPGAMEQYWQGVRGRMENRSRPTNLSAQQYQREFGGPGADAGLDPYYQRAHQRGSEQIDQAMAARGLYNSGAALQAQQDLSADLGAAQANREADYALRRISEGRLGAGQADQMALAGSGDERAWMLGGGNLANLAQGARRGRVGDYLNETYRQAALGAGLVGGAYDNMLGADQRLLDDYWNLDVGRRREAADQQAQAWNRLIGAGGTAVDMYTGGQGGGGR